MRFIIVLTLGLFISGCASSGNSGKFEQKIPETTVKPEFGYLKIHTFSYPKERLSLSPESDERGHIVYAPYEIYRKNQTLVKKVRSSEINPATVKLPQGEYIIIAQMSKDEVTSFAVNVEAGIILEVDASMLENTLSKLE